MQNVMRTAEEIERLTRGGKTTTGKSSLLKYLQKTADRALASGVGSGSVRPADDKPTQSADGAAAAEPAPQDESSDRAAIQALAGTSLPPRAVNQAQQSAGGSSRGEGADSGGRSNEAATAPEGHAAAEAPGSGAPASRLPLPLLQDILCLLDARSASSAARACRHFSAAQRLNAFFELSAPFEAYLQAMQVRLFIRDGDQGGRYLPLSSSTQSSLPVSHYIHFLPRQQPLNIRISARTQLLQGSEHSSDSDGSIESRFTMQCPLDGSPSCGAELLVEAEAKEQIAMAALMPLQIKLMVPGLEDKLQELKADYEAKHAKWWVPLPPTFPRIRFNLHRLSTPPLMLMLCI